MGLPERHCEALAAAGFTALGLTNRNEWCREVAAQELADLQGPLYEKGVAAAGREEADRNVAIWRVMVLALEIGELCPHHLRARKPA